jgi:hypothetical protein
MNSFTFFINGARDVIFGCENQSLINRVPLYNLISGMACDGEDFIDPYTGDTVKFPFPGDPVSNSGWTMPNHPTWQWGPAGDQRMFLNSGPITMAPGDTQEVVIAVVAARGSDHIQSIAELRNAARTAQMFYDLYTPELADINYRPPMPDFYYLSQNYPNPFNPNTKIIYELPLPGIVTLKVFDLLGQEIRTLINEEKSAGKYEIEFSSDGLSSGIYFYTFNSRAYTKTKKMLVVK